MAGKVLADIVIPVSNFHTELAVSAIASAHAQTIPVNVIVVHDEQGRGAAYARNQGAAQGSAPFITFLDADDVLMPEFVEECARNWATYGNGYVYTNWTRNGKHYSPPHTLNIFTEGLFHIVTTLLPRKAFEAVGGFNEQIATLEDEDLYRRLHRVGCCPHGLHKPLVEYRNLTQQGATQRDKHIQSVERFFNERDSIFKGLNMCACNDAPPVGGTHISGEYHEGDILAVALYTPRRMTSKAVAHRVYEKPLMGQPMWVHPADADMRPDLWQIALSKETLTPDVETVLSLLQS